MRLAAAENEAKNEVKNENMEIGGDEEANDDGDDAKKFGFFVRADAVDEAVTDLAIENNDESAGAGDEEADEHPANAKFKVIHEYYCIIGFEIMLKLEYGTEGCKSGARGV